MISKQIPNIFFFDIGLGKEKCSFLTILLLNFLDSDILVVSQFKKKLLAVLTSVCFPPYDALAKLCILFVHKNKDELLSK